MTIYKVTNNVYYFQCRDCDKALMKEGERKIGLCTDCLEIRVLAALSKTRLLVVNPPTSAARWN